MARVLRYVTTDAMGSVTSVLSSTGEVLERRSYDAFGQMTCMLPDGTPVATSPTGLKAGFHGQLMDELTGMYQMGYRWYSPILGRWLSRDPAEFILQEENEENLCVFNRNNPISRIDIIGLQSTLNTPNGYPAFIETLAAEMRMSVKQVTRRVLECKSVHAAYNALSCRGCDTLCTTKEEACANFACYTSEVALRSRYLGLKCDRFLVKSVLRGSSMAEKGHIEQLAQKTVALGKCSAKCFS